MAEHTKGPWSVAPYRTLNTDTPVILSHDVKTEPPTIAVVTRCANDSANALLIAAAPALLDALTRYRVQHDQQRWSHDRPCRCEMCQQAIEAIKAAKGQQ